MQEHIRRAHPEHYISKLPATEESFLLMINTPPSERPPSQQNAGPVHGGMSGGGHGNLNSGLNGPPMHNSMGHGGIHQNQNKPFMHDIKHGAPGIPRNPDEFVAGSALPAASAAAALAQLHTHKLDRDWDEGVSLSMGDVSRLPFFVPLRIYLIEGGMLTPPGLDVRHRKRPHAALLH